MGQAKSWVELVCVVDKKMAEEGTALRQRICEVSELSPVNGSNPINLKNIASFILCCQIMSSEFSLDIKFAKYS